MCDFDNVNVEIKCYEDYLVCLGEEVVNGCLDGLIDVVVCMLGVYSEELCVLCVYLIGGYVVMEQEDVQCVCVCCSFDIQVVMLMMNLVEGGYIVVQEYYCQLIEVMCVFGGLCNLVIVIQMLIGVDMNFLMVDVIVEEGEIVGQNVQVNK